MATSWPHHHWEGRKQYADYLRFDEYDSVFRYPGDTVWLEYRGFYTHHDNCYYSECNDSYILREDCFYSVLDLMNPNVIYTIEAPQQDP